MEEETAAVRTQLKSGYPGGGEAMSLALKRYVYMSASMQCYDRTAAVGSRIWTSIHHCGQRRMRWSMCGHRHGQYEVFYHNLLLLV